MKTLTVSLLSALCLAAPAWAGQGTPADSVRHLQGVEVTARLRQEQGINPLGVPAKKLPLTISSLADSTLSLRAITQVKDALRFVPAVQMKYNRQNEASGTKGTKRTKLKLLRRNEAYA